MSVQNNRVKNNTTCKEIMIPVNFFVYERFPLNLILQNIG